MYFCITPFIGLCSGLALLDINWERNDGALLKTHKHIYSQTGLSRHPVARRIASKRKREVGRGRGVCTWICIPGVTWSLQGFGWRQLKPPQDVDVLQVCWSWCLQWKLVQRCVQWINHTRNNTEHQSVFRKFEPFWTALQYSPWQDIDKGPADWLH